MEVDMTSIYKRIFAAISFLLFGINIVHGMVLIKWNPNHEDDLAGYKIYYGTHSRRYSNAVDVGLVTSYTISNLETGKNYYFALTAYDTSGNESYFSNEVSVFIPRISNDGEAITPSDEPVYNYPNPFDPHSEVTHIRYVLGSEEHVTIRIFDVRGKVVRTIVEDQFKSVGEHLEDVWDGRNDDGEIVQNGIYYCLFTTNQKKEYITIALIK